MLCSLCVPRATFNCIPEALQTRYKHTYIQTYIHRTSSWHDYLPRFPLGNDYTTTISEGLYTYFLRGGLATDSPSGLALCVLLHTTGLLQIFKCAGYAPAISNSYRMPTRAIPELLHQARGPCALISVLPK